MTITKIAGPGGVFLQTNIQVRHCPFCGSIDIFLGKEGDKAFLMICESCYAVGPPMPDVVQAVGKWNHRHFGSVGISTIMPQR